MRGGGRCRRRDRVEAVLLEELVQGHTRDAHLEGLVDEVQHVGAGGLGVAVEEVGDRPGVAGQELAVGAAVEAVMGLLDGLLGGEGLLPGGGRPADAQQASDLSDLEAALTMQQEVAHRRRHLLDAQRVIHCGVI